MTAASRLRSAARLPALALALLVCATGTATADPGKGNAYGHDKKNADGGGWSEPAAPSQPAAPAQTAAPTESSAPAQPAAPAPAQPDAPAPAGPAPAQPAAPTDAPAPAEAAVGPGAPLPASAPPAAEAGEREANEVAAPAPPSTPAAPAPAPVPPRKPSPAPAAAPAPAAQGTPARPLPLPAFPSPAPFRSEPSAPTAQAAEARAVRVLSRWQAQGAPLAVVAGVNGSVGLRSAAARDGATLVVDAPRAFDGATARQAHRISMWLRTDSPGVTVCLRFLEVKAKRRGDELVRSTETCVVPGTQWQRFRFAPETTADGTVFRVSASVYGAFDEQSFELTRLRVERRVGERWVRLRTAPDGARGD